MEYIFAEDLGTINDYTARSLMQHYQEPQGSIYPNGTVARKMSQERYVKRYALTYLERVPLGTSYPDIVASTKEKMQHPALHGRTTLLIDMTGVGIAVFQMMKEAKLEPIGINITNGLTARKTEHGYSVPKKELVTALQILFQTRKLKIAKGIEFEKEFVNELRNFRPKPAKSGNEKYEAWRESDHDDLVLSVAMAAWYCQCVVGTELIPPRTEGKKQEDWDPLRHEL